MKDETNSSTMKLQYGLKNSSLIHISDIPKEDRGLKCQCKCPACGVDLQARLGNGGKRPHFSHNNNACSYASAQQTILHMLAKDIINEELKVKLPAIRVPFEEIKLCKDNPDYLKYSYTVANEIEYKPSSLVNFDYANLEKKTSSIVPDVTLYKNKKICLIEIAVTHFIDEAKERKIKDLKLPTVEIDISSFLSDSLTKDELKHKLKDILINDVENKRWVYNPLFEKAFIWANNEFKAKIDEIELKKKSLEEKERLKHQQKIERIELTKNAFNPENYSVEINKLRNDNEAIKTYRSLWMSKNNPEIPFYCDIPISGEFIFNCDRRIWQTAIFNMFIYNRKQSDIGQLVISNNKIESWIKKHQKNIKVNWKYYHRKDANGKLHNLLREVILKYLWYLGGLGFIDFNFHGYNKCGYIVAIKTLLPPNEIFAENLQIALNSVDGASVDVDNEILQCLDILMET